MLDDKILLCAFLESQRNKFGVRHTQISGNIQEHFLNDDSVIRRGLLHIMCKYQVLCSTKCVNGLGNMERFQGDEKMASLNTKEI